MATIGSSGLEVFPLCLGGNVFGWTADERRPSPCSTPTSTAGGNFIDTADAYCWAPGNSGGESETIIGDWMAARGNRDDVVIATKVGLPTRKGLRPANIAARVEASLRAAAAPTTSTSTTPTRRPDDAARGDPRRLRRAGAGGQGARTSRPPTSPPSGCARRWRSPTREGLAPYVALQPHYNLVERDELRGASCAAAAAEGLSCVPYFGAGVRLPDRQVPRRRRRSDSPRAEGARRSTWTTAGRAVLAALDEVAAAHDVPVAAVALAWLAAQPTVAAPIASARTVEQLRGPAAGADLKLTDDEIRLLPHVSA